MANPVTSRTARARGGGQADQHNAPSGLEVATALKRGGK